MTSVSVSSKFFIFGALVLWCGAVLEFRGYWSTESVVVKHEHFGAEDSTELIIFYHDRRPYYYTEAGRVTGLVVEPARRALDRAGIEHRWVPLPPARQLKEIARNDRPVAAIGWFANPERKRFANFSPVIYRDEPFVVLTRRDNDEIMPSMALGEVLAQPSQTLLVKSAYSYGRIIDQEIARAGPPLIMTSAGNAEMIRMLKAGRADYALFAPEEARELLAEYEHGDAAMHMVKLSEMPEGGKRHMMFSLAVPGRVVNRIAAALSESEAP